LIPTLSVECGFGKPDLNQNARSDLTWQRPLEYWHQTMCKLAVNGFIFGFVFNAVWIMAI
jgi:hypothetical protein